MKQLCRFPVGEEHREEIEHRLYRKMRNIYRHTAMVILIIQAFMVCAITFRPGGPFLKPRRTAYFVLYLLLIAVTVLVLAVEWKSERKEGDRHRQFWRLNYWYMVFLCLWSTAITLNDQLGGNGLNVFTYMTLTVAFLGMMQPWQRTLVFVGNFLLLNALLPYFPVPSLADQRFYNLVNSGVITIFSVLISSVIYRNQVMQEYDQIIIRRQYEEIQKMNQRLEKDAMTDQMTGLKNRRYLQGQVRKEFQERAGKGPVSCIMLDIDFFKQYNDAYGHQKGDDCLVFVADLLKREVGEHGEDVIRLGGEEFAVLLFGKTLEETRELAERLRSRIESQAHSSSNVIGPVTISAGICHGEDVGERTLEEVVDMADLALYQAKYKGRNRVEENLIL